MLCLLFAFVLLSSHWSVKGRQLLTLLQESWDSVYGEDAEGPASRALRSLEEQV